MTVERLRREYYEIDSKRINGQMWWLMESNECGEEEVIATNADKYVYTEESLDYTVEHLEDEYEIYYLD